MPLGAVSSRLCPSASSTGVSSAGPRMSRGDLNLLVVRPQVGGVHVARTSFRFCCPSSARGAARQPVHPCLLYTSDAADEEDSVDLGGRRIIKKKKREKKKKK